jgi:hypothetical protein
MISMNRQRRSLPRNQTAHEAAFSRGLFVWVTLYLILTFAYFVLDRSHERLTAIDPPADRIERMGTNAPIQHTAAALRKTVIGALNDELGA